MSETATETTDQAPADDQAAPEAPQAEEKDWKGEAEKWKALARKHEGNAKANADKARQFDEFQETQKSELEKAQDRAAKAEKQATEKAAEMALLKAGVQHGLSEDDLALVGTHGSAEEIAERAERFAQRLQVAEANKPKADFGGGDRGEDVAGAKQLTQADLDRMSPEQIVDARRNGQFDELMGIKRN